MSKAPFEGFFELPPVRSDVDDGPLHPFLDPRSRPPFDITIVKANSKVDIETLGSFKEGYTKIFVGLQHSSLLSSTQVKELRQGTKECVENEAFTLAHGDSSEDFKRKAAEHIKTKLEDIGLNVRSVIIGVPKPRRQWGRDLLAGIGVGGSIAGPLFSLLNALGVFQM